MPIVYLFRTSHELPREGMSELHAHVGFRNLWAQPFFHFEMSSLAGYVVSSWASNTRHHGTPRPRPKFLIAILNTLCFFFLLPNNHLCFSLVSLPFSGDINSIF